MIAVELVEVFGSQIPVVDIVAQHKIGRFEHGCRDGHDGFLWTAAALDALKLCWKVTAGNPKKIIPLLRHRAGILDSGCLSLLHFRRLAETLTKGRVPSDARRQQFYEAFLGESERLRKPVEVLLDFGRIEAGPLQYRFESVDPGQSVRDIVSDLAQEVAGRSYRVELHGNGVLPPIRPAPVPGARLLESIGLRHRLRRRFGNGPEPCRARHLDSRAGAEGLAHAYGRQL